MSQDDGDNPSESSTVKRGMSFAMVSFIVNGAVGVAGAILTSRLYGVDIIGQYALVVAPWIMLIQVSNAAERMAFIREVSGLPRRDPRVNGLFFPVLGFSALITSVMAVPVLIISTLVLRGPADQAALVAPAIAVVLGYVVLDNTSANLDGIFSAYRAGGELFVGRLVQMVAFPLLAVALYPWQRSITSLTVATIGAFAVALLVRLVLVRRYLSFRVTRDELSAGMRRLPALLRFSLRVVPAQLVQGFGDQAGTWVLSAVAPIGVVGAWSRAFQLAVRMNEAGYRINEILFPTLSQRYRAADMVGFARALSTTARLAIVFMYLLAATLGGAAVGVLAIFGEGFDQAATAFAILLFTLGGGVVAGLNGQALVAAGYPNAYTVVAVSQALVGIGLLVPGAILAGATGAALALAVALVLEMILQYVLITKYVGPGCFPPAKALLAVLVASVLGFAVSRAVDTVAPGLGGTVLAVALGAAVYLMAVVGLGGLTHDERSTALGRARGFVRRGPRPVDPGST
jgi:O-antigen/teichoic acid export membrane protein